MDELKGKVKLVYEYLDNELECMEQFDENRNRIKYIRFKGNKITNNQFFEKQGENRLFIMEDFDDNGVLKFKRIFYYDSNSPFKKEIYNAQNQLTYREWYEYDRNGNIIKQINGLNEKQVTYEYEYNDKNQKTLKKKYNHKGILLKTQKWEFDKNNNKISYKKYNNKGHLIYYHKIEYNSKNKKKKSYLFEAPINENYTRQTDFDKDAKIFKEIFSLMEVFNYDSNHQKINQELDLCFFSEIKYYEYDSNWNRILKVQLIYRSDFSTKGLTEWFKEEWKYDDKNNVIFESEFDTHTDFDNYSECWFKNQYDSKGRLSQIDTRRGNENQPFIIEKFSYNDNDVLIQYEKKSDFDHVIKKYDAIGNVIYCKDRYGVKELKIKYFNSFLENNS